MQNLEVRYKNNITKCFQKRILKSHLKINFYFGGILLVIKINTTIKIGYMINLLVIVLKWIEYSIRKQNEFKFLNLIKKCHENF
jgi:hypothetical protein